MIRRRMQDGAQQVAQDGFTAAVQGAGEPVQPAPRPRQAVVARRVLEICDHADGTASVVRCLDPMAEDIDVQFEAGVRRVTGIAAKAFEGCTNLRRIILPGTIRTIGEMAFTGCVRLESVAIPGSVAKVGTLAFAKCASLARVRLEPGVSALGPSCFSKCTSLTRVDIPASVTGFGGGVFFGCGRQLTLHVGEGTMAQKYAQFNGIAFDTESFRQDERLIFEEEEDGTLTVLGPREEHPTVVEIPSELCGRRIARIAPRAFFACDSMEQLIIGGGVAQIGENAFCRCRGLTMVEFERGLERVGESAFAGCDALTQVTLPWGTQSIGRMAFFGCTNLSFVKMPTTTRVEEMAFIGCAENIRVFGGVNAPARK